jgi:hypothetical protein
MVAEIPGVKCTACGYEFDLATMLTNPAAVPHDGDLSICISCTNVDKFTVVDGVTGIRPLTFDEAATVLINPQVVETQRLLRSAQIARGNRG